MTNGRFRILGIAGSLRRASYNRGLLRAAQQVSRAGAQVLAILGVIDREQGGPENIAAAGYQAKALFRRSDLGL